MSLSVSINYIRAKHSKRSIDRIVCQCDIHILLWDVCAYVLVFWTWKLLCNHLICLWNLYKKWIERRKWIEFVYFYWTVFIYIKQSNRIELNWIEWIRLSICKRCFCWLIHMSVLKFVYRHFRHSFTIVYRKFVIIVIHNRFYWRIETIENETKNLSLPPCLRDFHFCKQKFSVFICLLLLNWAGYLWWH